MSTATDCGLTTWKSAGSESEAPFPRWWRNRAAVPICAALLSVSIVYAIPLLLSILQNGRIPPVMELSETIYTVRVAALERDQGLGNPYIAGHDSAPRYMPEMTERLLATAGRVLRCNAPEIATWFRILQPLAIFVLVVGISFSLRLSPGTAACAGLLTTIAPSLSMLAWHSETPQLKLNAEPGFLRYVRFLSAGTHTTLFLLALFFVALFWSRPTARRTLMAGVLVGLGFQLPIYYWSVLWSGALALWLTGNREQRRGVIVIVVIGALLASPVALTSVRNSHFSEVQQTLHRWPTLVMLPGRHMEAGIPVRLLLSVAAACAAWILRRRTMAGGFMFAFFLVSIPVMLENVVTNRQIQAYHIVDPLNPLWAIMGATLVAQIRLPKLALPGVLALLVVAAAVEQMRASKYVRASIAQDPNVFALTWRMPHALAWLQKNTPTDSVVMSKPEIMDVLPIFTHNKVYYASFARQHVMSDAEADGRFFEALHWKLGEKLNYPVDYVLAEGSDCAQLPANQLLFRDTAERTCVWKVQKE